MRRRFISSRRSNLSLLRFPAKPLTADGDLVESRNLPRNPTRAVRIGNVTIGAGHPIAVQSMTPTHTTNSDATVSQIHDLEAAGADVVRVAVDSKKEAEALHEISRQTKANLVIDLQENYRLAEVVAPNVAKLRYNP